MRRFLLPPFLPLLGFSLFFLGLAIYESNLPYDELPQTAEGEIMRWVMFVPFIVPFIYLFFLVTNLIDCGIARIVSVRFARVSFLISGIALALFLTILGKGEKGLSTYLWIFAISITGTGAMNWWRHKMEKRVSATPDTQP